MISVACRSRGPSSGNLGLATELHDLAEDVVNEDTAADGAVLDQTIGEPMTTVAVMKSEPTQKVFTETRSMTINVGVFSTSNLEIFAKVTVIQY